MRFIQNDTMQCIVHREHETMKLPTRGSDGAAGWDVYAGELQRIEPHERAMVSTGIRVAIPDGYFGRLMPRSGLAIRHGIDVGAGVIDSDYRGVLHVVLFNHGDTWYEVRPGTRIAQLVILPCPRFTMREGPVLEDETQRGAGGFGSTGMH